MKTLEDQIVERFMKVEPKALASYLEHLGWEMVEPQKHANVYEKAAAPHQYISIYHRNDFYSYRQRMREALFTLRQVEDKDLAELWDDFSRGDNSVLRFRYTGSDTKNGEISINDALRIRAARKKLILAAAHTVLHPQKNYAKLSKSEPLKLLELCREKPSQAGSYISEVSIPSDFPESDSLQGSLFDDQLEPFPRRVAITLRRLLKSAEDYSLLMQHRFYEDETVSSNFLQALSDLHPPGMDGALEVSFAWSRDREQLEGSDKVEIKGKAFSLFGVLAQYIKENEPTPGAVLEGYVTKLRQEPGDQDGVATIATTVDSKDRKVPMTLPKDMYTLAYSAHGDYRRIQVHGTLAKKGNRYYLVHVSHLEILDEEDEEEEVAAS